MQESNSFYGTGHRKSATARVWLKPGSGVYVVNHKPFDTYASYSRIRETILSPLKLTGLADGLDMVATVEGGGPFSQSEALRHGIAKALLQFNEELRLPLKKAGWLTRDPRVKERKKWGHKRARRGFQFSKR
jgi:small subunit ribosomal protein S9